MTFIAPFVYFPPCVPNQVSGKARTHFQLSGSTHTVFSRLHSCFAGNFLLEHCVSSETRVKLTPRAFGSIPLMTF